MSHAQQTTDTNDTAATGNLLLGIVERDRPGFKSHEEIEQSVDAVLAVQRAKHPDVSDVEVLRRAIFAQAEVAAPIQSEIDAVNALKGDDGNQVAFLTAVKATKKEMKKRLAAARRAGKCARCNKETRTGWLLVDCAHSFCARCTIKVLDGCGRCSACGKDIAWPPVRNFQLNDAMAANLGEGETQAEENNPEAVKAAFERHKARMEGGGHAGDGDA